MKITSHPPRKNYPGEYAIRNWKASGLDKPSTIRTMHIFRLHESELRYKIGRLSVIDIAAVKNILRQ